MRVSAWIKPWLVTKLKVYRHWVMAALLSCYCFPSVTNIHCNGSVNQYQWTQCLGLCWSRMPRLLPVSAASPSMDHKHGTVCQLILEHQIRHCAPSSVISRHTCLSSSLHCCWLVAQHRSSGAAVTVYKYSDSLAHSIWLDLISWQRRRGQHALRANMTSFLQYEPVTSTIKFNWHRQACFKLRSSHTWNHLPAEFHFADLFLNFQSLLWTHYCRLAFNWYQ